jgi:nitrate reductase delta subunit
MVIMQDDPGCQVLNLFAKLLEYPTSALADQVRLCVECLPVAYPVAADHLVEFLHSLEGLSQPQVEELYTSTFDMQPICYPYVGYHLFGDSYKRGAFMAKLIEGYRAFGYSVENELPDHVAVILRFFALSAEARRSDFGHTLLLEGFLPALQKMIKELEAQANHAYLPVFSALSLILVDIIEKEVLNA